MSADSADSEHLFKNIFETYLKHFCPRKFRDVKSQIEISP